jgi:hypothetical protein
MIPRPTFTLPGIPGTNLRRGDKTFPRGFIRQEVVAMSNVVKQARLWASVGVRCAGPFALVLGAAGCASVAQDVDAYYRQMAVNYQEARDQAKMDATTLENESKVLAVTGDTRSLKRNQKRLTRIQAWEDKCDKESVRFEKAAEWTEAHFHLAKPAKPAETGTPGRNATEDAAVEQALGSSSEPPGR